jgi:hypothetical protein
MNLISKKKYLGLIYGLFSSAVILMITGAILANMFTRGSDSETILIFFSILSGILIIISMVFYFVTLYKVWQAIQAIKPRSSPGKAVGFLFIPFFNWYWVFIAYWGWLKDYNSYLTKNDVQLPRVPEGVGMALAICKLPVFFIIPVLNLLVPLAAFILDIIFLNLTIDGANRMIKIQSQS